MSGKYPKNWEEIADKAKKAAGNKCERCGKPDSHNPADGNCLTVHHLVPDKSLCKEWNLAVLCQRCHLYMQKVNLFQGMLDFYEFSDWFKPHLEGFLKWLKSGRFGSKDAVTNR